MSGSYALVDGNAFYCSCERVFDAGLRTAPVVVLSNNDGCAIARTAEAKALGIAMGDPWFRIRTLCRREGVRVFSSNYALYGEMSERTNHVYRRFSPAVEVYSIDESFLDVGDVAPGERGALARDLRSTVLRWTGIPTCVGIGPTKTLAKLANRLAKGDPAMGGVCDLTDPAVRAEWLGRVPHVDVWGVGPAYGRRLAALGCATVADVARLDHRVARRAMTVVGERIVHELNGFACLPLEAVPAARKGCAVTRMFGRRTDRLADVEQSAAAHASRLGEKLRREGLATDNVTVFYHTSDREGGGPQRSVSTVESFPEATSCSLTLAAAAARAVRRTWRDGHDYAKSGVVATDLVPLRDAQRAMPGLGRLDRERSEALMAAVDRCNRRFGRGTVGPASAGVGARQAWRTRFERRSPRYTTRIDELPVVKA